MNARAFVLVCILFSVGFGCVGPKLVSFSPLASHSLRVGPEQEADVVWILKRETAGNDAREQVLRCRNSDKGPLCEPAEVP